MNQQQVLSLAMCSDALYFGNFRDYLRPLFPEDYQVRPICIHDSYAWDDSGWVGRLLQQLSEEVHGRAGFIGFRPDCTVLAFRGSEGIIDWFHNLWQIARFDPIDAADNRFGNFGTGRLHEGWVDYANRLWNVIKKEGLLEEHDPSLPLFVTGHSLGGAAAKLIGNRLELLTIPVAGVCSFAAPRVGDNTFAQTYAVSNTLQFQRPGDIVPLLPHAFFSEYQNPQQGMIEFLFEKALEQLPGFEKEYQYAGQLFGLTDNCVVNRLGSRLTQTMVNQLLKYIEGIWDATGIEGLKAQHNMQAYHHLVRNSPP